MNETTSILDAPHGSTAVYGGFWLRVAATIIDRLILSVVTLPIMFFFIGGAFNGEWEAAINRGEEPAMGGMYLAVLLAMVIQYGYFIYMESSERQATFGKSAVGLKVTNMDGGRISVGQAAGRTFGKIISGIIIYIGYIMVAFTEKKQGLHDMMAGTLVVKK